MKTIEYLFDLTNQQQQRWDPTIGHDVRCPLCWRRFGRGDLSDLSIEHVPPSAAAKLIGEKALKTLTCRDCNNAYGSKYQKDLTNFLRSQLHQHGKYDGAIRGSIKAPDTGIPLKSNIVWTPGSVLVTGVPRANDPVTTQQHVSVWDEIANSGASGWSFTVTLNYQFRPPLVWSGYLEVAYLAAYVLTECAYPFTKAGAEIRRLITSGDSSQIGPCLITPQVVGVGGKPWSARVAKPDDLQCLWVKIAGNIVILPPPSDDGLSCYRAWQELSEQRHFALSPGRMELSLSFGTQDDLVEARGCLPAFLSTASHDSQ